MSDDALYAQLDTPEARLVLADALQQRGDPRGELIVVQHALETASVQDSAELDDEKERR